MLKKITNTCLLTSLLLIGNISIANNINLQAKWEAIPISNEIKFGGRMNKGEDGKLYIAGASDNRLYLNSVYQFNTSENTWKQIMQIDNNLGRYCNNQFAYILVQFSSLLTVFYMFRLPMNFFIIKVCKPHIVRFF